MTDATRKYLDEVRKRYEKATLGPWAVREDDDHAHVFGPGLPSKAGAVVMDNPIALVEAGENDNDDAFFIAHAREDIPRLLALVERLRKYAGHQDECPSAGYGKSGWAPHGEPCTCGFNRVWEDI